MEPVIRAQSLGFAYRGAEQPALRDVTFEIFPGECVLLCGKSGCGKTTLTRLFNGLSPAFFAGTVTGQSTAFGLKAGEAAIEDYVPLVGSVLQNPKTQYFNTDTTAELAFPCENAGVPSGEIARRVAACAKRFGLEHLLGRSIFQLSGGEKQRIAFGAATMLAPKLLILDEPTSNLDAGAIDALRRMILEMKAEGMTILLAEHRLAWASGFVDRYFYFDGGELKHIFPAAEFCALPDEKRMEMGLRASDLAPSERTVRQKAAHPEPKGIPLLEAHALTVGYNRKAPILTLPDLALHCGEIVGLMGHNGIGKTTLTRTLCGLLSPLGGEIRWQGHRAKQKELVGHSFLVMQDVNYQLFSDSVREEVLLGAAEPEHCDEVLEQLGLGEVSQRHPMSLSGGQKQRTAIACAMLSGKELICMDEPTSGLDCWHMQQVGQLLQVLKEQGRCVLVITHDAELAAGWCDRIITLEGEIHAV